MIKKIVLTLFIAFAGFVVWKAWPIYGFYSNQFETARLPFGWISLPADVPSTSQVIDPDYEAAGRAASIHLAAKREAIGAPSLSAAVVVRGELVWVGTSGWQDVKSQVPATPKTVYRLGSSSKPVTATALARLVSTGVIDLDRPISDYVDNLPNSDWGTLTPRQLSSHTAGIVGYEEIRELSGLYHSMALVRHYEDVADAAALFDESPLLFAPGTDFHYSSNDVLLVGLTMQEATGQPYLDVMDDQVFSPLQLESIVADSDAPEDLTATFYQNRGETIKPWRRVDLSSKLPGGGFVGTPSDVALLGAAWLDEDFIAEDVRDTFWTPVEISAGVVNEQNYALGWRRALTRIDGVGEIDQLNHGGVSKGAQFWVMVVPEYDISLAVAMNARTDEFFDFAGVYKDLLATFIPVAGTSIDPDA